MTIKQLCYNPTTRVVYSQTDGDAIPSGFTKLPDYIHDDTGDELGDAGNHVLFHHVRDALYKIGVLDVAYVSILLDTTYVALTALSIAPATVTLAALATQQITPTFTPVGASNQVLTYTTSDATKATVSVTGLVTAVATGSATITATSSDGGFTDTVVVTIS